MAATGQRFVVSCRHCKRIVVITTRIADAELDQLRAHLLACCPDEMVGPGIAATLRHFRVLPTDSDAPPDAA